MARSIGFRAFKSIVRPPQELIEKFRDIPVANIADNMNRLYVVDTAIKPMNKRPVLGPAFTVKTTGGDNLMIHKAMAMAEPGDVLVIDGMGDMQRSLAGDIMATYACKRKFGGMIFDGCIRDIEGMQELDIPIYARGVTPRGPYKNGPGEIGVPVCLGGQAVLPGDIIVGDMDGIVVIRPDDAEELAEKARAHNEMEKGTFQSIAENRFDHSWMEKLVKEKGLVYFE